MSKRTNGVSSSEDIKASSAYLRGEIAEELRDGNDKFGKETIQLLKHHGVYQQDDRDLRGKQGSNGKSGRHYSFMVRSKVPGGKLTADQMRAQLEICDALGNGTLRLTTRQGTQFHGVVKGDLWETIHRINSHQMSTLAACGDVERNIMCCPAPIRRDPVRDQLQNWADRLADHLAPRTPAYHELWIKDPETSTSQRVGGGPPPPIEEPIYGPTYLPRKFKTGIGLPEDNCVDLHTHDLGLLALHDDGVIHGFNVIVGGGFGNTPSAEKTFPALGQAMAYVSSDRLMDLVTAVVKVQRDFGNRADRKVARMKYLVADWGLTKFRAKVEEYFGGPLDNPFDVPIRGYEDHLGWNEQGDGRWWYGLNVENGRIKDVDGFGLKSAVREVCQRLQPGIRITPHQSLLFTDLEEQQQKTLEQIFHEHGVPLSEDISTVRRWSMACVALPTCGLAITESERVLPGLIDQLERELTALGLDHEKFTVRMTGCPNACARPYNADIGLVGKAKGKYTLFLGGRRLGDRLNFIYKDLVPLEQIIPELLPLFTFFRDTHVNGETFGDFCHRQGRNGLLAHVGEHQAEV